MAEEIEIRFAFELKDLVSTKPFYNKGKLVVPSSDERYQIIGRQYAEGIVPGTSRVSAAKVYNCIRVGAMFGKDKEKVYTVQEKDIMKWSAIQISTIEIKNP